MSIEVPDVHRSVAIFGAGSVGLAMAGHLSALGYRVRLWNRDGKRISEVATRGRLRLCGQIEGDFELQTVTTDMAEALEGAEWAVLCVPATAHRILAEELATIKHELKLVLLNPGRCLGTVEFDRAYMLAGGSRHFILGETQTVPHTCRTISEDMVCVYAVKKKVAVAAFPAADTSNLVAALAATGLDVIGAESVLELAFNNMGALLHPTPTLLNVGWIESERTAFRYYYEGVTQSVAEFLEVLDAERVGCASAYGIQAMSLVEWMAQCYGTVGDSIYAAIQSNQAYREIDAPQTIRHRYVQEDVPTGLVTLESLAVAAGAPHVAMSLVVDMCCSLCRQDFRVEGRTLESLGLGGCSVAEILDRTRNGLLAGTACVQT